MEIRAYFWDCFRVAIWGAYFRGGLFSWGLIFGILRYNVPIVILYGSSGILAGARVAVTAEADFPYCYIKGKNG